MSRVGIMNGARPRSGSPPRSMTAVEVLPLCGVICLLFRRCVYVTMFPARRILLSANPGARLRRGFTRESDRASSICTKRSG